MSGLVDPAKMLAIATEAVERAGQIILNGDPGTVTDKGDRDLSSEMDLASEHAVRELLSERTPDIPLLGEEEGGPDCPRRRTLVAVNIYDHGIGASYCVAVVRVINLCDELPGRSP